jgi:hypothetical protein
MGAKHDNLVKENWVEGRPRKISCINTLLQSALSTRSKPRPNGTQYCVGQDNPKKGDIARVTIAHK